MICDKLKKYLDENGVLYQVKRHGEAYTAQEVAESLHVRGRMLVKVVMIKSERGYIMAALPADRRVDIAQLRDSLGMKMATLATEDEFKKLFPDCEPGAMPPFGNLYGVPVYVDRSLTEDAEILFQAGNHYEAVMIRYADFDRLVQPRIMKASRKAA